MFSRDNSPLTDQPPPHALARSSTALYIGGALILIGGGFLGTYAMKRTQPVLPSAVDSPAQRQAEALPQQASAHTQKIEELARSTLEQIIELTLGKRALQVKLADLGLVVDPAAASELAATLEHTGVAITSTLFDKEPHAGDLLIPLTVNKNAAISALVALKHKLDSAPRNAHLRLDQRTIYSEQPGQGVDIYAALAVIEQAARTGQVSVELPAVELPAERTRADLGIDDISHVLARFTTRFSVQERTRNANLKLAASRIHGHIIQPGEVFSFNKIVGARSEKEGYKIAHVITAGEMVDGLAGGACQISTTLHGAAFFSGLDIVSSTPHSRPSTYVEMGLDATVVWPHTDLKLRNPYDFPVAVSFRVARGKSTVEILGKERPYDEIAFEREVEKELEFDTITREDNNLPVGSMLVEQDGFPGYELQRLRKFYKNGKIVKTDTRKLFYRPVTEYARLGINPDPNLPQPEQKAGHGPKVPKELSFRMVR